MLLSSFSNKYIEVGVDEVGRGCLAGPVVAAAVILPMDYQHPQLKDSKKLSKKQREILKKDIERDALAFAIAEVDAHKIDEINILNASFLAMHKALDIIFLQHKKKVISIKPEFILVDGNRFKAYKKIPHACIIKGDNKYLSIAAASILAKVYRDDLMENLATSFPQYGWQQNAGYPTKLHKTAIQQLGLTIYHRKSFKVKFS